MHGCFDLGAGSNGYPPLSIMPLRFYIVMLVLLNVLAYFAIDIFNAYCLKPGAVVDPALLIAMREANIVGANILIGWLAFGDWVMSAVGRKRR